MRSRLWLQWTIVNAVSFAVARVVSSELLTSQLAVFLGSGAITGAIVGVSQELLLRRRLRKLGLWTLVATVAGELGWLLGLFALSAFTIFSWQFYLIYITSYAAQLVIATIFGASVGAIVGWAQCFIFLRLSPQAYLWIVASILGQAASWTIRVLMLSSNSSVGEYTGFVFFGGHTTEVITQLTTLAISGALGGIVYGAITGFVLTRRSPFD